MSTSSGITHDDDTGVAVVRSIFDAMSVDARYSIWSDRGFRWWGNQHAQDVWSEPGIDDDGITVYRVLARTELLRDFHPNEKQLDTLALLNTINVMSALIHDPAKGTLNYFAHGWVHDDNASWMRQVLSTVAAMQASMGNAQGELLAGMVGGTAATSSHPTAGRRRQPDDMMGFNQELVGPAGRAPSAWAGPDLAFAAEFLGKSAYSVLASGGPAGLSVEFPHKSGTMLLRASSTEPHPTLGNGLAIRLDLPTSAPAQVGAWANGMNTAESAGAHRGSFLGSWTVADGVPTFMTFIPNLLAVRPGLTINLILPFMQRARWVAETLGGDDWDKLGRMAEAVERRTQSARAVAFGNPGLVGGPTTRDQ